MIDQEVFMWGFGWGGFADRDAASAALWVVEVGSSPRRLDEMNRGPE